MDESTTRRLDAEAEYLAWEFGLPGLPELLELSSDRADRETVPTSQYGTTLPAKVIADLARERADQHFAPIDVDAVLAVHRVGLKRRELPVELAYVLVTYRHRVTVVVPSTDIPVYQRFSAAHALGYHLAGPEVSIHLQFVRLPGDMTDATRQSRAVEFASALLMPEVTLRDDVEGMVVRSPKSLSEQYQVSPQSMAYRLRTLGLMLAY